LELKLTEFEGERLSIKALLQIQVQVLAELKARKIVRGNNAPIGDVAEYLVFQSRGGVLEPNSTKSHDVTDSSGRKIQVKARSLLEKDYGQTFSAFRTFKFDTTIFIVFDPLTSEISWAREVEAEQIKDNSYFQELTNSYRITAAKVLELGNDVTKEIAETYSNL